MAGALYVPQAGIINPSEMQPSNSIEMAVWVAVGGRGTLIDEPVAGMTHQETERTAELLNSLARKHSLICCSQKDWIFPSGGCRY